jgi:hypothetical protein
MEEGQMVRKFRVFVSAGTIASLLTLLSVAVALAGDNTGPLPK